MLGTYITTITVYQLGAEGRFLATRQENSIYFPITTREAGCGTEAGNGDWLRHRWLNLEEEGELQEWRPLRLC